MSGFGTFRSPAPAPPGHAEIHAGHLQILRTFRELGELSRGSAGRLPDRESLAACVAFLRHSVSPFGRWEEDAFIPGTDLAEDTSFEHAFLAAETEALAAAVESLDTHECEVREQAKRALVWRQLVRIESALELHMWKAADRPAADVDCDGGIGAVPVVAPGARPLQRAMSEREVDEFLSSRCWGVLATSATDGPYAVPVTYAWREGSLFFATAGGKKASAIDTDPRVALTVVDVDGEGAWECVVVRGRVAWITDPMARVGALRRIASQKRAVLGSEPITAKDLRRMMTARVARVDTVELTGRRNM
jgi:nitroimidazol reductase NimA-like FMN-containing flavoprotein (pyridoxamine 5'-phosphate oxidase superfamily)